MQKAVMYGAGNIGRGFIGQLFSQSGYEVVFIDVIEEVVNKLNEDRCYPVKIVSDNEIKEITVENVRAVNGMNPDDVADEISTADIMATAVGVNVLSRIAALIAAGLKKRWEKGNSNPLNIIICENLLDANKYLEALIKKELSEQEKENFDRTVGLVEASIGRMVPVMTEEMREGNILKVWVEPYSELPVDRDAFKGEIPEIKNMLPFSPFEFYIQRKLFIHNMGHALTAYLGYLKGYKYIWEAIKDPCIKLIGFKAMIESARALSLEHGVQLHEIIDHVEDLQYRFGNKRLGDSIERVGKDPARKLSQNDRFIGAANLCLKHGIKAIYIYLGVAAGLFFDPEGDPTAGKVQEIILNSGPEAVLNDLCNVQRGSQLTQYILKYYGFLSNRNELEGIIPLLDYDKKF
jgi:mannitol-1-phosphate 5-dehydrogenase